jgi:hypothetical protein
MKADCMTVPYSVFGLRETQRKKEEREREGNRGYGQLLN